MMAPIDYFLDRITMYRLTLYVLIGYVVVAAALWPGRAAALLAGLAGRLGGVPRLRVLGGELDPRVGLRRADERANPPSSPR